MDIPSTSDAYWDAKFREAKAFWKHDGNPKRPYALLSTRSSTGTRRISNAFFKGSKISQRPALLEEATRELVRRANVYLRSACNLQLHADVVVAPAKGAVMLGYEMTRRFPKALAWFTEPEGEGAARHMALQRFDEDLSEKSWVLGVEDVVTTGASGDSAIDAVLARHRVNVYDCLLCLANRSGFDTTPGGKHIISLVTMTDVRVWNEGSNPYTPGAGAGNELVEPVDPDH